MVCILGVLDEIQLHFDIKDTRGGLLLIVFVISYMIFAPLFGYLGDRYSRRWIMVVGVFLWSLTTLLGSYTGVRCYQLNYSFFSMNA
jgi:MFS family permease